MNGVSSDGADGGRTGHGATAAPRMISPGLAAAEGLGAAFELKYQLDPDEAGRIEAWARQHLHPDRNGDGGKYRITSVYCDTPTLDVFHRSPGFRRSKLRLRRYDDAPRIFLEKKSKRGDRVTKMRTDVDPGELARLPDLMAPTTAPAMSIASMAIADQADDWAGAWFGQRARRRGLRPTCCVSYRRTAFFGMAGDMPVRLTIDRDMVGTAAGDWSVPRIEDGHALLPGGLLLELKFHLHLPPLFRDLLGLLPGQLARASKYRRCVELCGISDGRPPAGADGVPPADASREVA